MTKQTAFIFGLAGWSGSGKTTLAEKLITAASGASIAIATLKHAHHDFDADIEGKDSWRHRKAGAGQVLIASDRRMAHFTENTHPQKPQLADLLGRLAPCDWVLVEGFKRDSLPKIEIYDSALQDEPLYRSDPDIFAVVAQEPLADCPLPYFHRDDIAGLFAFLQEKAASEGYTS